MTRARLIAALCLLATAANLAAEPWPARLDLGVGMYDPGRDDQATDFSAEYRLLWQHRLQPRAIFTWATDGSRFIGVGLVTRMAGSERWELTLGFTPGFYEREHGRSVGVSIGHLSNGSLGDDNPGAEVVRVFWSQPFGR